MSLTFFDIIVITTILIFSLFGLYKGAIKTAISFVTFILSIISAYLVYPDLANILKAYINNEIASYIVSIILSYILSTLLFGFVCNILTNLVKPFSGGIVDSISGFFAGVLIGYTSCLILFIFIAVITTESYINVKNKEEFKEKMELSLYPEWLKESVSTPFLYPVTQELFSFIPKAMFSMQIFNLSDKTPE